MTVYDPQALPSFVLDYRCLSDYDENAELDSENGLTLKSTYIPEEVMLLILSYVEPKQVLRCSLVCRKWNRLIKSFAYWSTVYKRHYKQRKPKKLPWYVYYCLFSTDYFDTNLINKENWVKNPRAQTRYFSTVYETCWKRQTVSLQNSKLFSHIVNCYKPHIYLSEWTAPRDKLACNYIYKLSCIFRKGNSDINFPDPPCAVDYVKQWSGQKWKMIELIVKEYPEQVDEIGFERKGRYTEAWVVHYIPQMAGAVIKFLFDTIEPLPIGEDNKIIPKKFSKSEYTSTGQPKERLQQIQNLIDEWLDYDEP